MDDLNTFKELVSIFVTAFMYQMDFMGLIVRPLDFILFTGGLTLITEIFRMVVFRGTD